MNATLQTAAGNPENQDRGAIIHSSAGLVLVVADGVGGQSGGAEAATLAIEFVRQHAPELLSPESCVRLLQKMDQVLAQDVAAGETTCALAVVTQAQVFGASVGDSGVWVMGSSGFTDLTHEQPRRPFIGSGCAWPAPFTHGRGSAEHLLLATDGLLKYTSPDQIVSTCRADDLATAAQQLIQLVRYRSGALPDDVTVILAQLGGAC